MTSDNVKAKVDQEIAEWRVPVLEPGSSIGRPWDAARYEPHLTALRAALVSPYRQRFALRETYEQALASEPPHADYWVVAVTEDTVVWFDSATADFGLAKPSVGDTLPESIGVRGDLVGVFCAR